MMAKALKIPVLLGGELVCQFNLSVLGSTIYS